MSPRFGQTAAPGPVDEATARLGMVLFLASWAMLFGSLFFAYAVLRLRLAAWPEPGSPALPLVVPLLNTGVLLGSSRALEHSLRLASGPARRGAAHQWLLLALGLGLLFVALQLELWWSLSNDGLAWGGGTMAALVYGLTIFHALHVLVGLGGLGAVWLARRARLLRWRLWTTYWHFVSVVWAVMFFALFIV